VNDAPLISDYALLGDCHGSALVSRDGSVDWWCAPRFDAPSVFTRLLDPEAGHWSIRPPGDFTVERHYVGDTMVLRTLFTTPSGRLRLTDALALGPGEREHEIGKQSPHVLLRLVEVIEGTAEIEFDFSPRPEYGLVTPELTQTPLGVEVSGGADTLILTTERKLQLHDGGASGRFMLRNQESLMFGLHHHRGMLNHRPAPLDGRAALADTVAGWQSWADAHQGYYGPYQEQVKRSALVLQALTFQPTGAVVAAATTSLPEKLGGTANWDYRFGWLRDGSLTLNALWVAACPDEAERFFSWMTRAAGPSVKRGHVQIMFGVQGEHDLTEHELSHLAGYQNSAPVRVGNDAWRQKQLDVYGEILDSAWVLREQLGELALTTRSFLASLADRAADSWEDQDAGIWEGREGHRHYLTSKLMCWVALDRATKLGPRIGDDDDVDRWKTARGDVRRAILEHGWSEAAGAYTGAFGSDHLDAGVLLMPIMGFVAASDERMLTTIDAIERDLTHNRALVQRWTDAGEEGGFVICSYWLAACRALAGDIKRAEEIFDAVTAHANDLGLLSEEIDIHNGKLLGNFPQALSHIGLINAASAIGKAQTDASTHCKAH
jgi:GH15 family glucan-1,4-alpha-glucosidase